MPFSLLVYFDSRPASFCHLVSWFYKLSAAHKALLNCPGNKRFRIGVWRRNLMLKWLNIIDRLLCRKPITVAARSKAWTISFRSNTGIVGSSPARGMGVCVYLFSICVLLCVGSSLTMGWFPIRGVLPTVYTIKKLKTLPRPKGL
jgi:hypothetical protein